MFVFPQYQPGDVDVLGSGPRARLGVKDDVVK